MHAHGPNTLNISSQAFPRPHTPHTSNTVSPHGLVGPPFPHPRPHTPHTHHTSNISCGSSATGWYDSLTTPNRAAAASASNTPPLLPPSGPPRARSQASNPAVWLPGLPASPWQRERREESGKYASVSMGKGD